MIEVHQKVNLKKCNFFNLGYFIDFCEVEFARFIQFVICWIQWLPNVVFIFLKVGSPSCIKLKAPQNQDKFSQLHESWMTKDSYCLC